MREDVIASVGQSASSPGESHWLGCWLSHGPGFLGSGQLWAEIHNAENNFFCIGVL